MVLFDRTLSLSNPLLIDPYPFTTALNFLDKGSIVLLLSLIAWILLNVGKCMWRGGGDMCQSLTVDKGCKRGEGNLVGYMVCNL